MQRVEFKAYGHENVIGNHKTTVELTSEDHLTRQGTCIIGVKASLTLNQLDSSIKELATSSNTKILLKMSVDERTEEIIGTGSPGLTYTDPTSMVARTSNFESGRTLMVNANKAASDLDRKFVDSLKKEGVIIECELVYITQ
ncbi:MAG: DUF371 domain-containing protein [Candidatus Thorarchaeota archaeon]